MKKVLIFHAVVASLGGFLFGFDTAVISGAEQSIQKLWALSDFEHGLAVAIALYGTVLGALFAGIPVNAIGRKKTLIWIGILYFISALGSALAPEIYSFMILRFIGGVGVGASSVAAPMYISEIAPPKARGRLVALFQFNITFGIVIAYLSNFLVANIGENAWRWMLGIEAIPAFIFASLVFFVPKSPRWLIALKNDEAAARKILEQVSNDNVDKAIDQIKEGIALTKSAGGNFFSPKYRKPIMLAFLFAFFNQVSGINAIIYFAPRIFEMTGLGASSALLSSTGVGITNLVFCIVGIFIIDKLGRRSLMIIGSFGLILTLSLIAYGFFAEQFGGIPAFLFIYIAFFSMSQGAVIWVFISEIFPNKIRAQGQSFGSFTHWILAAIIANVFPYFAKSFGGGPVFSFFAFMMFLQLLFVWKIMPETKNRSLEELEKELISK
ncbi:sugar porter family MFS transporter [Chondrinema litorale]|uniref:sugar porter family MFS transporter n=1 Tax=Chondrinema litorale TaxID=2994555 RepID=UPI0025431338|nr:sugar porter family MFS transporter [Chondrinema litorale]UZR98702.1 sugar porter family MFS transporter [Chondrinema litorale]